MRLGIAMGIEETLPGEAFAAHLQALTDAYLYVLGNSGEVALCTTFNTHPHDFARYTAARIAIEQGCDRLMFMDDDTITPATGIRTLMQTMDSTGAVAVSGLYYRRGWDYRSVWSFFDDAGKCHNLDPESGNHVIHGSGLGCCLLDLRWMQANLPQPWFKMQQNDHYTIVSDDVVLFEGIRKAGGIVIGNADVACIHVGKRELVRRETVGLLKVLEMEKRERECVK